MKNKCRTWNKYSNKVFLIFKDKVMEKAYQKSVYKKLKLLVLAIIVFVLSVTNTLIYYFLTNPPNPSVVLNRTNTTDTKVTSNSTITTKCSCVIEVTQPFKVVTTFQQQMFAYIGTSAIGLALILL